MNHAWQAPNLMYCGSSDGVNVTSTAWWFTVDCLDCLRSGALRLESAAKSRLAELDREQATVKASVLPSVPFTITLPTTLSYADWSKSIALPGRVDAGTDNSIGSLRRIIDSAQTAINSRDTLLLRASSFIADLPSGSLDRARNVEAQAIRRAIADLVVGKDKPR